MPATKNHSKDNLLETGKPKSFTLNVNQCSTTDYRKDNAEVADMEMCECSSVPLRLEENVLLRNVAANRGMIHQYTVWYSKQSTMHLSYLIGIPFGWLLFGTFQYFVCIVILGDSFLDPWYFTCAWIVELISTLPVIMIITIIKCLYVQVEILEHCEKVTWIGFTFLLFQGLTIIILLLPVSNLFKHMIGDFSRPINFFIYWMMLAFPHIIILCFATFGCCSKVRTVNTQSVGNVINH
ncbi:PREDICTED: uncharacterized protein LOC107161656 [Diuraphis noxia]|uniref:uncharacterized protein LOC107161656 n=1 Tax=Diuraphis noxia TaxID=143948 RepID=UPI0007637C0A|nr:PREDICTED: uncharacterized protein LOC107161656 [Diuraphis noxia]XP_015363637.1 PREDICTED: uncharacterized protein LOC107161656 [Diuraphis noxia]